MNKAYQKISERFETPEKKQLTFNIDVGLISRMDKVSAILYDLKKQTYTKNAFVEDAISAYVDEIEKYLIEKYHTSIEDYHFTQERKKTSPTKKANDFNLVVYPGHEDGFQESFLKEHRWYPVRIHVDNIDKVDYIAIYLSKPISAITHYAKVLEYKPSEDFPGKYVVYLDKNEIVELENPVPLGTCSPVATRSPKYTTLDKLKNAKSFSDL